MSQAFRFEARDSRKIADPVHDQINLYRLYVPARKMPDNLPLDANARTPDISKRIYKDILASLLNDDDSPDNTFHLKNRGITIVADKVCKLERNVFEIHIRADSQQGIVDGGHTYDIVNAAKKREVSKDTRLTDDQLVVVEIREGLPQNWIVDVSAGLNTSLQVKAMSLDNLAGEFEWIKEELRSEPYFPQIAWFENDEGICNAMDVLALLHCFNIELYPLDSDAHPVIAYSGKSAVLKKFESDPGCFKRMRPILKDILLFHDEVHLTAASKYKDLDPSNKPGLLKFIEAKGKDILYPFRQMMSSTALSKGALYPILGAFRCYVRKDEDSGEMHWKGGFGTVLDAWNRVGGRLIQDTRISSEEYSYNIQTVGKSKNHWQKLCNRVLIDSMTFGKREEDESRSRDQRSGLRE